MGERSTSVKVYEYDKVVFANKAVREMLIVVWCAFFDGTLMIILVKTLLLLIVSLSMYIIILLSNDTDAHKDRCALMCLSAFFFFVCLASRLMHRRMII